MTPESPQPSPVFTPPSKVLSLGQHWMATGRRDRLLGAVQLLVEGDNPRLWAEARDLLGLVVEVESRGDQASVVSPAASPHS